MLKGTILKNIFKLSAARCASYETAERLLRHTFPTVYQDEEFVLPTELGDITFCITRESFPTRGFCAWRIVVLSVHPDPEVFPECE